MPTRDALVDAMERLVGADAVLSQPGALKAYDCDAYSLDRATPRVVVLPSSREQVRDIVRWCLDADVPFTPRGAGTGLSGGAMDALGGVILSSKRLNRILDIDVPNRRLWAQAGAVNLHLTQAVEADRLHFAPDPSSQSVCTLGGNIAENSGGPHTLKYGVTAQHILALTLVDPDGEIITLEAGGPGFDFVSLVVGSEGTLGIVTDAWVRLTPTPEAVRTALIAFPTVAGASQAVAAIIASGVIPAALEMMDRQILAALRAAFGLDYPEGTDALLLVECDGCDADEVDAEMAVAASIANDQGALQVQIAHTRAERAALWTARKKGIGAMGWIAPTIITHDGVIPRSKLPEMLEFVATVAEEHGLMVANLFHAGDGNLHPCIAFDDRDPAQVEAVIEAGEKILRRCIELGGSVSGEHGIGVEKIDLLQEMFTADDLRLQADAKRIFNKGGLCNACKVLPNQKGCLEHRRRWRGVAT
ncbi:MAG TPA: FAD-linked oxidase C-terminal domain-containing protein [Fimbriimonadaceae bacterium]|nr:FAD-linked oxidase C-terminal domain-containing protein [Fimbriimonadaceae bacterium]